MYFFNADQYNYLYGILSEYDSDAAEQFASYFSQSNPQNTNYYCNNASGYESFLAGIFEEEDYSDFTAWSGFEQGKSTQGGGTF